MIESALNPELRAFFQIDNRDSLCPFIAHQQETVIRRHVPYTAPGVFTFISPSSPWYSGSRK